MTSLPELVTEKPGVWIEKTHRKEEGGTWISRGLLDPGSVERKTLSNCVVGPLKFL